MRTSFSDHAMRRMKQRGITYLEVEFILQYPEYIKRSYEGKKEAVGTVQNRTIKIVFFEDESIIRIITVV